MEWRRSLFEMPTIEQIARVWNDVRSVKSQVAVDLQGAIRSAVLARMSRAPVIYGARHTRESPATLFYTRQEIARGAHVIEQNLSLVQALTETSLHPGPLQLPHDLATEQRIHERLAEAGLENLVIINPGAGWGAKRWPAQRYGAVARALACCGLRSVVNYGPGEDQLAREAEQASEGAAKAFAFSLTELIALTRRAKLFIGGDTGPLHLAAALQVPTVAIFGPTDPARNGPYGARSVVLRNAASQTSLSHVSRPDPGLLAITTEEVISAAPGKRVRRRLRMKRGRGSIRRCSLGNDPRHLFTLAGQATDVLPSVLRGKVSTVLSAAGTRRRRREVRQA